MKSTATVFILVTGLMLPAAGKDYRLNIRDYPTTIKQLSDLAQRARRDRPRPSAPPTTIKQLSDLAQQLEPGKLLGKRLAEHYFSIQGDVFTFDQGDLPTLTNPHGYASVAEMPLLIPLARHIQLVALREYIQQQPNADPAFWESYFKEADVILEESLAAIDARQLEPPAILELVKNKDADIKKIFDERAPNHFAQSRKLQQWGALSSTLRFTASSFLRRLPRTASSKVSSFRIESKEFLALPTPWRML